MLVVPELPEDDERPTTVEGGLLDDVRGVVVVSRRLPPPHHHQPVLGEVREPPLLVLLRELELQRSGCHRPVLGSWRQTEEPV